MKILLDTHILIWATSAEEHLSEQALEMINDLQNEIYYSAASIWEIVIKHKNKPEKFPFSGEQLLQCCEEAEFLPLLIENRHVLMVGSLENNGYSHHDPFDRLLIAQAKTENMLFVTHDNALKCYNEPCVALI